MILEDGAVFIADAHYPHHNSVLLKLLKNIEDGEIETKQLFLMGDIFDLLFRDGRYVYEYNREAVEYINRISERVSVIYLEGNHDFCLKKIFPKTEVIPRDKQPLCIYDRDDNLYCLSHGDRYETGILYNIYSAVIRSPITISLLSPLEKTISKKTLHKLSKKHICGKIANFEVIAKKILSNYPVNATVIEGHYHQGTKAGRYISLPSLACENRYARYINGNIVFYNL